MSKPLIGILVGAVFGAFDGLTAWFTPEVRDQLTGIVVSSTIQRHHSGRRDRIFREEVSFLTTGPAVWSGHRRVSGLPDGALRGRWLLF